MTDRQPCLAATPHAVLWQAQHGPEQYQLRAVALSEGGETLGLYHRTDGVVEWDHLADIAEEGLAPALAAGHALSLMSEDVPDILFSGLDAEGDYRVSSAFIGEQMAEGAFLTESGARKYWSGEVVRAYSAVRLIRAARRTA